MCSSYLRCRVTGLTIILFFLATSSGLAAEISHSAHEISSFSGKTTRSSPRRGTTFVVNTTDDSNDWIIGNGVCETGPGNGICTLRAAIAEANSNPGKDTIKFNIPGAGPHIIKPSGHGGADRYVISTPVLIDGYSQPGSSANTNPVGMPLNTVLRIVIDGTHSQGWTGISIGGTGVELRGLVVQNFPGEGIFLAGSNGIVAGCFVGTDVTGLLARPNHNAGIGVGNAIPRSMSNRIGGLNPADRNLISGNANTAISINDSEGTLIQGNLIGTTPNGVDPLGNQGHGIEISGSSRNTIGGVDPGAPNVIAFNMGDGVSINEFGLGGPLPAISNSISRNSIYSNFSLGINLGIDFVTPNDPLDLDTGANDLQNFPVLGSVVASKANTTITGSLDSTPVTSFRIEFFSNQFRDPSGFGEGKTFLGFTVVTTDITGLSDFQFVVNSAVKNVTATATDLTTNETSEFSSGPRELVVNSTGDDPDSDLGDTVCSTGRTITRGSDTETECTLRAAMEEANAVAKRDRITFNIPVEIFFGCGINGICTIQPRSALPTIIESVIVDGFTQPGAAPNSLPSGQGLNTNLKISVDGTNAGAADGFRITSNGTQIRGLNISRFEQAGIYVDVGANDVLITGNFIGTDVDGAAARPNLMYGVSLAGSDDSMIGGSKPADRNLISGNGSGNDTAGIVLSVGASGNTIAGNLIGTNISGTAAIENAGNGIRLVTQSTDNNTIIDNVISGNGTPNTTGTTPCFMAGVAIVNAPSGNTIRGNKIGLSVSGTAILRNQHSGVCLQDAGNSNTVDSNIISGNGTHGIEILKTAGASPGAESRDTIVRNNSIGTKSSGVERLPNGKDGVYSLQADNMLVQNNVISGNVNGISIKGGSGARILGNKIGTDLSGEIALANSGHGILLNPGNSANIGGFDLGDPNIIAYNAYNGIQITGNNPGSTGNSISRNSIFLNGLLGIDLGGDGVTPNDPLDQDTGANDLQNFPMISSVVAKANTTISGTLLSTPLTNYRIEFFSNPVVDPSGFGEGKEFLGSTVVATDLIGTVDFQFVVNQSVQNVSATATDLSTNNTSEFAGQRRLVVNSTGDDTDSNPGDITCHTGRFITRGSNTEPECTLRAAMEEANAVAARDSIAFDIPVANDSGCSPDGVCTIVPEQALPDIVRPLLIDGSSQSGWVPNTLAVGHGINTKLTVIVDGKNIGGPSDGFRVRASNTWIRGMNIRGFRKSGVHAISPAGPVPLTDIKITGSFIGTDLLLKNSANLVNGVFFEGVRGSFIGGPAAADRNVISGNGVGENTAGIRLGAGASHNTIEGNLIGTKASGEAILENGGNGLVLENAGTDANIIVDNVISGNGTPGALVTRACSMAGVLISDTSAGNILRNNYIGLSASGTLGLENRHSGVCLQDAGAGNKLKSNTISGNGKHGVEINVAVNALPGHTAKGTEISNNFIGTDPTGNAAQSNSSGGIFNNESPDMLVRDNVISGNLADGITIDGGDNPRIIGNKIGTDLAGLKAIPNTDSGIVIADSRDPVIGTSKAGEGNLVSGNGASGIVLKRNTWKAWINNNRIGTDVNADPLAMVILPNGSAGIEIQGADLTTIGGIPPGEKNIISGNIGDGIHIVKVPGPGQQRTEITGNHIGGDFMVTVPVANGGSGVYIEGVSNIKVDRNTIASNGLDGVRIKAPAVENIITKNSMFSNFGLGIDLGADGVTANDRLDADAGANNLMNTPVIGVTGIDAIGTLVSRVRIDAAPTNAIYPLTVEFFKTDSDRQEGKKYMGSVIYKKADAGKEILVKLWLAFGWGIAPGDYIVATATDTRSNTSEFSPKREVAAGVALDYGDAPETGSAVDSVSFGYPTLLVNDGARHVVSTTVRLGDFIDEETDGLPTIQVAGDDLDNLDDDDGIVFNNPQESNPGFDDIPVLSTGQNNLVALSSVSGYLNAWIDFNRDGDWEDVGEQIFIDQSVSAGPDRPNLSYQVPDSAKAGLTVARFRFSTESGLAPTGMATNGEVEDYLVRISEVIIDATEPDDELPDQYALYPNYPNPFNPTTRISYAVRDHVQVHLSVYDALGRRVAVLVDLEQAPGRYEVTWDARSLPSGLYLARIRMGAFEASRTMLLLK